MAVRLTVAAVAVALLAAPGRWAPPAGAVDHTVAVALFYAPTPVTTYSGLIPEEYVSDDMSAKLVAASAGRFSVVPRAQVRTQEGGLRWRESDALRFARLSDLAHAAGADRVVVGWIESLVLDRLGGGGNDFDPGGGEGGGTLAGYAVVTAQVFDASQGRIVYQAKVTGHSYGPLPMLVIEGALDDAVRRAALQLAAPLTATP
jgi:curli biogenesis system outer membrane secretion channel CsgG